MLALAPCGDEAQRVICAPPSRHGLTVAAFHGDTTRAGWNDAEPDLGPAEVASGRFGPTWSSAPFDAAAAGGVVFPGRMYASPLYADDVTLHGGSFDIPV
jgi:hypothetical protein